MVYFWCTSHSGGSEEFGCIYVYIYIYIYVYIYIYIYIFFGGGNPRRRTRVGRRPENQNRSFAPADIAILTINRIAIITINRIAIITINRIAIITINIIAIITIQNRSFAPANRGPKGQPEHTAKKRRVPCLL